ncbi:MAG: Hsp33 family molecular chaperone HslO [Clostridia bacterium]|nr:Hsp33 family molecular chaperone HslO [Clostridia bacterium]
MDKIIKSVIFGKKARITLIDSTEAARKAAELHGLSPLAAAALGRALTAGAYIGTNLKTQKGSFSMIIKGGGPLGNIVVAGESGNKIRGFAANPLVDLPPKKNGKLDVGGAVGNNGSITVIKDLGLKRPYNGTCELVSGEIAEDFAYYLLKSEGIKSAVNLGVRVNSEGVAAAGGIIAEALPGIDDNMLFILEDIMSNLAEISSVLAEKGIDEVMDYYFGHLDAEILSKESLTLECNCSEQKIKNIVLGLGQKEAMDIVDEIGKLEVCCQFCNKKYVYNKEEVRKLWEK